MEHVNGNGARALLEKPFDPGLIRTRPGTFGADLSYVEGHEYIRRLNDAFSGQWSFEVVKHEIGDHEVIVIGKLSADGVVKMAFGGAEIKRRKESREIVCLADDLKAAATDSLKKCASFLGVGLHLYSDAPAADGKTNGGGSNGNGAAPSNGNGHSGGDDKSRLTSRQLSAIVSIGKERGLDRNALQEMTVERFQRRLEFLSKADASAFIDEIKNL